MVKIPVTSVSKIFTALVVAALGALVTLLTWNVYTTHLTSNAVVALQTSQGVLVRNMTQLVENSTVTTKELSEIRVQTTTGYNTLSGKIDDLRSQIGYVQTANNEQDDELSHLKVKQAELGGPNDPNQVDIKALESRVRLTETSLIKIEGRI